MRRIQPVTVIVGLLFSPIAGAESRPTNRIDPLPRDLEIQLALSALPPHLRDNATVYVLNPAKGFEVAGKGTNGFHAFVARTGDDTFRGSWPLTEYRDDILYPISFDKAGAKAQMRVFVDAAEKLHMNTKALRGACSTEPTGGPRHRVARTPELRPAYAERAAGKGASLSEVRTGAPGSRM